MKLYLILGVTKENAKQEERNCVELWAAESKEQLRDLIHPCKIPDSLIRDLQNMQNEGKRALNYFEEIEKEFAGCGYGVFKPAVGDAVIETLRPIREEATRLLNDKAYLCSVYTEGAQKASFIARKILRKVYKKVGLVDKPF